MGPEMPVLRAQGANSFGESAINFDAHCLLSISFVVESTFEI